MKETTKYDFLDGLRGLAIVFVLLSHIHYTGYDIGDFFHIGLIGVPLFFMISAYTLALSQDNKGIDSGRIKQFFLRRFFRIYPLYILMITIVFILAYLGVISHWDNFTPGIYTRQNFGAHLFFFNGFFHDFMNSFRIGEWSLFNEVFFYCLFPFVFPFIRNSLKNTIILLFIAIGIYGLRNIGAMKLGMNSTYIYHFFFYHLIDFSFGFLLFHLHKKYFLKTSFGTWKGLLCTAGVIGFFCCLMYLYAQGHYINHLLRVISLFGISIATMLGFPGFKYISSKVLIYLGHISYSLYLINLLVLNMIGYYNPFPHYPIINTLLALGYLLLLSSLSYEFEKKGIQYGKKI